MPANSATPTVRRPGPADPAGHSSKKGVAYKKGHATPLILLLSSHHPSLRKKPTQDIIDSLILLQLTLRRPMYCANFMVLRKYTVLQTRNKQSLEFATLLILKEILGQIGKMMLGNH